MFTIKKSLVVAMTLAAIVLAVGAESQAGYVFGKEPVARHNQAALKRRIASQYRYTAPANRSMVYRSVPAGQPTMASTAMVQMR